MDSYKTNEFQYNIRKTAFGKQERFFIYVFISCKGVTYQVAEKNSNPYPALSENYAKKKIMKILKKVCIGTRAEEDMKKLPIFKENGYQEELF